MGQCRVRGLRAAADVQLGSIAVDAPLLRQVRQAVYVLTAAGRSPPTSPLPSQAAAGRSHGWEWRPGAAEGATSESQPQWQDAKSKGTRRRWEATLVAVLFVGYIGRYFTTSHLDVSMIRFQESEEMSAGAMSDMLAIGAIGELVGKLGFGILADKVGGRVVNLYLGNLACAAAAVAMTAVSSQFALFAAWFLTSVSLCGTWPGIVRITSLWVPPSRQGRVMGILHMGNMVGDVVVRAVLGALLGMGFTWRGVFLVGAAVNVTLNVPALLFLRDSPADFGLSVGGAPSGKSTAAAKGGRTPRYGSTSRLWADLLQPLLGDTHVLLVMLLSLQLVAMREFFLHYSAPFLVHVHCAGGDPTLSAQGAAAAAKAFHACVASDEASQAGAWASILFPLVGAFSTFAAGWLKDVLHPTLRAGAMVASLLLFHVAALVLWSRGVAMDMTTATFLLLCCAWGLVGPYSLVTGVYALDLGGKARNATVSGLLNASGSLGAILFMLVQAQLHGEWHRVFGFMTLWVVGALVVATLLWRQDVQRATVLPNDRLLKCSAPPGLEEAPLGVEMDA